MFCTQVVDADIDEANDSGSGSVEMIETVQPSPNRAKAQETQDLKVLSLSPIQQTVLGFRVQVILGFRLFKIFRFRVLKV
jgi:hypothetical protein